MEDEITEEQLNEESKLIKAVDKYLIAERIAIEVKVHLDVYKSGHPKFVSYLITSKDIITYTNKEELEILKMAKKILNDKYNIKILYSSQFKAIYKSSK